MTLRASISDVVRRFATASLAGRRSAALLFFVVVALVYVVSPAVNVGDSRMSLPTAVSMYRDGDLQLDEFDHVVALRDSYDVTTVDGHLLMGYPYAPSVFLVPVAAVVDLVPGINPGNLSLSSPNRTWLLEFPVGVALSAVAVVVFLSAARRSSAARRQYRAHSDLVVALVVAFGTVLWSSASRSLTQHAAAAPFVALTVYLALRSRTDARLVPRLGLVVALAYIMRPTNVVLVVLVSAWVVLCHRRAIVRYVLWAAMAAVPFVAINVMAYRAVLPPYYSAGKWGTIADLGDLATSLPGVLMSPSRGLLLFTPLFVLVPYGVWLRRRQGVFDAVDRLFVAIIVAQVAIVAVWPNWWGGSSFGPRLLAESVPFLGWFLLSVVDHALALRAAGQTRLLRVVVVLAVASVAVHSQGAAVRATICWNSDPTFIDFDAGRVWDWSDPQPLRGIRELLDGHGLRDVVLRTCHDHGVANPNT